MHGNNVNISAACSTPPYAGTGNFTAGPGTHNYTVSDANGCTAATSITVNQSVAPLNAIATAGSINCYGGTTSVTVSAVGGAPPYAGTGNFIVGAGTHNYSITDASGC